MNYPYILKTCVFFAKQTKINVIKLVIVSHKLFASGFHNVRICSFSIAYIFHAESCHLLFVLLNSWVFVIF